MNFFLKVLDREIFLFSEFNKVLISEGHFQGNNLEEEQCIFESIILECIYLLLGALKSQFDHIENHQDEYFTEVYENENLIYNYFSQIDRTFKRFNFQEAFNRTQAKTISNKMLREVYEVIFYPLTVLIDKSIEKEAKQIYERIVMYEIPGKKSESKDFIDKLDDYKFEKVFSRIQKSFGKAINLSLGINIKEWLHNVSKGFILYLNSFNKLIDSICDVSMSGQKKVLDPLLKGNDGEYYKWLSTPYDPKKDNFAEDLINLTSKAENVESISEEEYHAIKSIQYKKIQVMLYQQLLHKYESFLHVMTNFGNYFENQEWVIDFESQKIVTKLTETLFRNHLEKYGFKKINTDKFKTGNSQAENEQKNVISKEMEDISMKFLIINANFRSQIVKVFIRELASTVFAFFDKDDSRYLQHETFKNSIIEKFNSYNYLFDQIQQGSNDTISKFLYFQQRRLSLGMIAKDYFRDDDKSKMNLSRFWKQEILISIQKIFANTSKINKKEFFNRDEVKKAQVSQKSIFVKYLS